jgi:hypothetical protein
VAEDRNMGLTWYTVEQVYSGGRRRRRPGDRNKWITQYALFEPNDLATAVLRRPRIATTTKA